MPPLYGEQTPVLYADTKGSLVILFFLKIFFIGDFKVNKCNGILLIKYPPHSSGIMANATFFLLLLLRNK